MSNDIVRAITFCKPNWYLTLSAVMRKTSLERLETGNVVAYLKVSHFITSVHYQLICHVYFADTCWKYFLCLKFIVKICTHYIHKMNAVLMSYVCWHVQYPKMLIRLWWYFIIRNYIKSCQAILGGFVAVKYKPHFMQSSNQTLYTFYQIWIILQIILT